MMTGESALELLSPELQRLILLQLVSLDALHALIRASARFYQVFRINKNISLSTIVRRQLPSSATQDALAIEKVSQLGEARLSRDSVLAFFKFTSQERRKWQNSVLTLPMSIKLSKLDKTVHFFIIDYAQNTLPILAQLGTDDDVVVRTEYEQSCHASPFEPSKNELKRLKRAFCRFETYRQLFARCSSDFNHDLRHCSRERSCSVFEQGQISFQHTPAYQVAEVACIRDYLFRRLRGVFTQVEDEAVKTLQTEFPNPRDKEQAMEWDSRTGGRYRYFHWDEGHYFTYNGKYDQNQHIEHLLSLGLPYIRRILESTGHERRDLLLRHKCGCSVQRESGFLTAALGLDFMASFDEQYGQLQRGLNWCLDEKTRVDQPPAWLWAHADGSYSGLVDTRWKALRDWGYVFWDSERLWDSGILDRE